MTLADRDEAPLERDEDLAEPVAPCAGCGALRGDCHCEPVAEEEAA